MLPSADEKKQIFSCQQKNQHTKLFKKDIKNPLCEKQEYHISISVKV